ncbi:uncharacterized protein LOC135962995 [Calliphora vicina]|uniref:uncharacterized protein LOC135950870 n=3 Tax=Calliphora vicina TaxID=7373 RepID=UPI00325C0D2F
MTTKISMESFFEKIRNKYNIHTSSLLKKYSREMERLAKLMERTTFLQECRHMGIIPTHVRNSTRTLKQLVTTKTSRIDIEKIETNLHAKLLNIEIKDTHTNTTYTRSEIRKIEKEMKNTLDKMELTKFKNQQWDKFYNIRSRIKLTHSMKMTKLKHEKFEKLNLVYNDDWFINHTSIEFEMEHKWLLSLGNKFAIPVDRKNFTPIPLIADMEQWVQGIKDDTEKDITRSKIANRIAYFKRNLRNTEKDKFILSIYEVTRNFIKKHEKDIIITTADKGNKTVILYRRDYMEKMYQLLDDKSTYRKIEIDPTTSLQKRNNNLITQLGKDGYITRYEKFNMTTQAAAAPELYGLPKIHKDGIPLRPISASMKVPCYSLSKYIGTILRNIVSPKYNIQNSVELKRKLESVSLENDDIMVSFDVVSLFTNIPIHLAIRNILDKWKTLKEHTAIPRQTFLKILQFCLTDNNYLTFDNKFYHQTYGMPMGNPLSPTIANIVLDTLLDDVIDELRANNIEIKFITKYVDDLFAIIRKSDEEKILKTMNVYHNKIQFTIEREKNMSIPYLDINIIKDNGRIRTNWYTKPTSSGRMVNFNSTQPLKMKISTATNLIRKVLQISDVEYRKTNINRIRKILTKNSYPTYMTNNLINKVLKYEKQQKNPNTEEEKVFYSVPFIPKLTETKTMKRMITEKTTTIAYKSNMTLRHLFTNNKTKIDKLKSDNVVYEIKCDGNERERCNLVYIGTTKRMLGTRVNEHKTDIEKGKITTALSLHVKECNHKMDFDNIKILDREQKENKRYTLESLRIQQKIHNTMNTKEDKDNTKLQYSAAIFNY